MPSRNSIIRSVDELNRHLESSLRGRAVYVVGICGMAGSGKTALCDEIIGMSSLNIVRLDCDQFSIHSYDERQASIAAASASGLSERIAFAENPKNWYAFEDVILALRDLRSNRSHTYRRAWNRKTGKLDEQYQVTLAKDGPSIVLCDCIYLLHDPVITELDVTILVDTAEEAVIERGQVRSRGDASRAAYMERLRQTYSKPYFEDLGDRADFIFKSTD